MVGKGTSALFFRFLIRNKTFLASIRKMGEKKTSSCPSLPLKLHMCPYLKDRNTYYNGSVMAYRWLGNDNPFIRERLL